MRSMKQIEASKRNHLVMRLRGTYRLFKELESLSGMDATDAALLKLGAETETDRIILRHEELIALIWNIR